jgi:hypothetical protein
VGRGAPDESLKDVTAGSPSEPGAGLRCWPMIDLGCIAGLHDRNHELHAYCCRCNRWQVLDLARMVRQGKGSMRLPLRVRCLGCGNAGQLQVRPPMPARGAVGWIGTGSST